MRYSDGVVRTVVLGERVLYFLHGKQFVQDLRRRIFMLAHKRGESVLLQSKGAKNFVECIRFVLFMLEILLEYR